MIGKPPSLEEINFHESKLDEDEARILFSGLNERKGLKRFKLGSVVAFDRKETCALVLQLLAGHSNLEELELGRSPPISRRDSDFHIAIPLKELAQALPSWPSLKILEFYELRNKQANDKALAAIGRVLKETQSLQEFRLLYYRSGRTGSIGLASLMDALAGLPRLQKLVVSWQMQFEVVNL